LAQGGAGSGTPSHVPAGSLDDNQSMRRFLSWFFPVGAGVVFAILLGWGFVLGVRGDVGEPITAPVQVETPRVDRSGPLRILILGDSVAKGTGDVSGLGIGGRLGEALDAAHRKHAPIVNLAVNGARTKDLIETLTSPNVLRLIAESGVIVVSIGGNDLHGEGRDGPIPDPEGRMAEVLSRVKSIVGTLREANPRARIFLLGLYNPFRGRPEGTAIGVAVNHWNARLVQAFATDPLLTVVQTSDLFVSEARLGPDRFHPGEEAYRIIGRRIAEAL